MNDQPLDDQPLTAAPVAPPAVPPTASATPKHRRWRTALAGGLAGGVIVASVAIPGTMWLERQDATQATAGTTAQPAQTPAQLPAQVPQQPLPQDGGNGSYTGPQTQSSGTDATLEQSKGVVLVNTVTATGEGAGTGVILSADGLVLTNYHVVEDSTTVTITVATTGDTYDANVVGYDRTADVALLQLDGASNLTPATVDNNGTSTQDAITAVGNAEGQGYLSAVTGTIVAENQDITASEGNGPGASAEALTGLIETNAPVVPGYSGGPLLDAQGEVVGIDTAASTSPYSGMSSTSGQSYAVPIDDAMAVVDKIEAGDESGTVTIGPTAYLGIGIANTAGTQVAQVANGGPAAKAGLVAGDTITAVDNTTVSSYDALVSTLANREPGDRVTLSWTDASGTSHQATVTLGANPVN
jgi:S1-C subfamily serine protease